MNRDQGRSQSVAFGRLYQGRLARVVCQSSDLLVLDAHLKMETGKISRIC